MKLDTLLEIQRCYGLLRDAEVTHKLLVRGDYEACLTAWAALKIAIREITGQIDVEVTK